LTLSSALLAFAVFLPAPVASAKWKYFRSGNAADSTVTPRAGLALMGGGEQNPALKFLCERANGGDFLILRANTEDDYAQKVNDEIRTLCPLNSAATIVFSEREDSDDQKLLEHITQAEAIFIAGGDQSNYVRFWQDTPVQDALNRHIAAGKPIGGSSAGLAVLGEFSFSSMIDTIHSPDALADPYGNKVTISRDFLRIPLLAGTITDTHFAKRERMGRLVVFLARILQDCRGRCRGTAGSRRPGEGRRLWSGLFSRSKNSARGMSKKDTAELRPNQRTPLARRRNVPREKVERDGRRRLSRFCCKRGN
jgi:cyanophycinase